MPQVFRLHGFIRQRTNPQLGMRGLFLSAYHGRGKRPPNRNNGSPRRIGGGIGTGEHFLLDVFHEILNLALHLFQAYAHLQDDGNPTDEYA